MVFNPFKLPKYYMISFFCIHFDNCSKVVFHIDSYVFLVGSFSRFVNILLSSYLTLQILKLKKQLLTLYYVAVNMNEEYCEWHRPIVYIWREIHLNKMHKNKRIERENKPIKVRKRNMVLFIVFITFKIIPDLKKCNGIILGQL